MMDETHQNHSHEEHSENESDEEHWDDHVHLRGGGEGGQRELGEVEIARRMLEVREEDEEEGMVDDYGRPWIL